MGGLVRLKYIKKNKTKTSHIKATGSYAPQFKGNLHTQKKKQPKNKKTQKTSSDRVRMGEQKSTGSQKKNTAARHTHHHYHPQQPAST
jgi:hypothetical protein